MPKISRRYTSDGHISLKKNTELKQERGDHEK